MEAGTSSEERSGKTGRSRIGHPCPCASPHPSPPSCSTPRFNFLVTVTEDHTRGKRSSLGIFSKLVAALAIVLQQRDIFSLCHMCPKGPSVWGPAIFIRPDSWVQLPRGPTVRSQYSLNRWHCPSRTLLP